MLTVTARLVLFASSYAPLLALFAILDSFGRGWPSIVCAATAAASVLALPVVWAMAGSSAGNWLELTSSRNRDADVMAFFITYVVPFAAPQDATGRTRKAEWSGQSSDGSRGRSGAANRRDHVQGLSGLGNVVGAEDARSEPCADRGRGKGPDQAFADRQIERLADEVLVRQRH
jgi:hypothetical protein